MSDSAFIIGLQKGDFLPNGNIFDGIWKEYERVIFESLLTSFGLDFFIKDQTGGDVDTILNVRNLKDEERKPIFKNQKNATKYNDRGEYDGIAYHKDARYRETIRTARKEFDSNGTKISDTYVPGNTVIPRNNPTISREHQGQLDHVISAKSIHNDPGRVLAGIDGMELANNERNLRYTNAALNRNKSDMSTEEYIAWCEANPDKVNWNGKPGEPLPEEVKSQMRKEEERVKTANDMEISRKYYTSRAFFNDSAKAAGKLGLQMGIRQAMGFILAEVYFTFKEEMQAIPSGLELKEQLVHAGKSLKKGFENALTKYKDFVARFFQGALAGAISSLTTTFTNIFFTTSKNMTRCIRQMYASVVQAAKVLFFNPDNLYLGERLRKTTIIIATGASVLAGTTVYDMVSKSPLGSLKEVGPSVCTFSSLLVSGLISCTLLLFMDRSKFINHLVNQLNEVATEANNFAEIATAFENLAVKMSSLDIEKFKTDTKMYNSVADRILGAESEEDLNQVLHQAYKRMNISIPWEGDFKSFMGNKSNRLVFG